MAKRKKFDAKAAFKAARARMHNPDRAFCKHRHPITLANADLAHMRRDGHYSCKLCVKLYTRRRADKVATRTRKAA